MRVPSTSSLSRSFSFLLFFLFVVFFLSAVYFSLWEPEFLGPFVLALLAGLSTLMGGALVVSRSSPISGSTLCFSSGLAGGVMIFVSLLDLLAPPAMAERPGAMAAIGAFAIGAALMEFSLRKFPETSEELRFVFRQVENFPDEENSLMKENPGEEKHENFNHSNNAFRVFRFSLITFLVLLFHNFPEGLSVFLSSVESGKRGVRLALAIAMHNLPEGIMVATPLYWLSKQKTLTLQLTALSGLAEPLGALFSLLATRLCCPLSSENLSLILSGVGGLMFCVSVRELLPEGRKFHTTATLGKGIFTGFAIMTIAKTAVQ